MTAPTVSPDAERFAAVTAVDRWLHALALDAWSRLRFGDLQGSFVDSVLPSLLPSVIQAQTVAAELGGTIAANRTGAAPLVRPAGFAGVSSSGESLASSLARPLSALYVDLAGGRPWPQARAASRDLLDQVVVTEVHDSARQAEHVQLVADRTVTYYVRDVEPKACSRCILLAGRRYRWSQGFRRHPRCRCSMFPEVESIQEQMKSPQEIFDSLPASEQDRVFTNAGAQAIRDGADIGRVVNARKGMSTAIGNRKGKPIRPMPEDIYRQAGGDRAVAVQLLRQHGFIR